MIYRICKFLCHVFALVYFRFQAHHLDRVPKEGGYLLVANHTSFLDPPLSGIAIKKPLYFLARKSLYKNFFLRHLLPNLNVLPIDRGRLDLKTFRKITTLIQQGSSLVIFPEGTRSQSGDLQKGRIGTGMIIKNAKAKVVPCYISGAGKALPKGFLRPYPKKVQIIFGKPIDFSQWETGNDKRENYAKITEKVMQAIHDLKKELEEAILEKNG